MEVGRSLISSSSQFPLRVHFRNSSPSPSPSSSSSLCLVRHSPTSVLIQDHHSESRTMLSAKEDSSLKQTEDERLVIAGSMSSNEKNKNGDADEYLTEFANQLLHRLGLWFLCPSLHGKEHPFPMSKDFLSYEGENLTCTEADMAVALAREALLASQEAASISKKAKAFRAPLDDYLRLRGLAPKNIARSKRLLDRQAKKRVPKPKVVVQRTDQHEEPESIRQGHKRFYRNDPLKRLLQGPETKPLTAKEESELLVKIQALVKLQKVKSRLETQFSREPTILEWAAAAGISCRALQAQVHVGNISRDKLIYAHLRMVVHIAKKYQGRGLGLVDLCQAGSKGLIKSVEKFKPQGVCRFSTYAYYWIRQTARQALFKHSRTICLPAHVYTLLSKVTRARKKCIQNGNHRPKNEDIAAYVGWTVEKLESLLRATRKPESLQQLSCRDQDYKFEEIIADTTIELPDVYVSKKMMRQRVRNLLNVTLDPRERMIIRMRFGQDDGVRRSLSEIGHGFGLTKERIRQLESGALSKLRQCVSSEGLGAYEDWIV